MFGSDILDIAIGLVLVYLLLSLIMTSVQETISTLLQRRATNLERALTELLQGDKRLVRELYDHPLIYALHRGKRGPAAARAAASAEPAAGADAVPPPAAPARAPAPAPAALPSYIPRETFSAALLDFAQKGRLTGELKKAYDGLDALSGGDATKLRREIEDWYDGAMDRAAGWYKRHTQAWLFFIGLAVSILLNVNSVTLAQHLAVNPQARAYADRLAQSVAQGRIDAADPAAIRRYTSQLDEVRLPIGWNAASLGRIASTFPEEPGAGGSRGLYFIAWVGALVTLIVGYLTTAVAIMLGAPFWFDLLNRIMVVRATVKPKEKSPDEPSQDGGTARRRESGRGR